MRNLPFPNPIWTTPILECSDHADTIWKWHRYKWKLLHSSYDDLVIGNLLSHSHTFCLSSLIVLWMKFSRVRLIVAHIWQMFSTLRTHVGLNFKVSVQVLRQFWRTDKTLATFVTTPLFFIIWRVNIKAVLPQIFICMEHSPTLVARNCWRWMHFHVLFKFVPTQKSARALIAMEHLFD